MRTWRGRAVALLGSSTLTMMVVVAVAVPAVSVSARPSVPVSARLSVAVSARPSAPGAAPVSTWVSTPAPAREHRSAPLANEFRWPLDGRPRVVRRFDPPPQPWQRGHRGVDLAAPAGATVRAAGAGVVLFAGMVAGRPVLSVGHRNGLRTTYEPVRPGVAAGDQVGAGDVLGVLLPGHPGCPGAGSACLHWGLRRGTDYLDPLLLLGIGPVRLLPVGSDG